MTTEEILDYAEIASKIGVDVDSVRTYHKRAEARRKSGTVSPIDMPAPARRIGQSPVWDAEAIAAWIETRENRNLGQGAKK
jgi:predicted DNA-binding transcriptional regulator AlpA